MKQRKTHTRRDGLAPTEFSSGVQQNYGRTGAHPDLRALPPTEVPRLEGESRMTAARRYLEICDGCSGVETNR